MTATLPATFAALNIRLIRYHSDAVFVRIEGPTRDLTVKTAHGKPEELRALAADAETNAADLVRRAEFLRAAAVQMEVSAVPPLPGVADLYSLRDRAAARTLTRDDYATLRRLADAAGDQSINPAVDLEAQSASWWDALRRLGAALPRSNRLARIVNGEY